LKFVEISAGVKCAPESGMNGIEKRIVYVIRSDVSASRFYVGITNDIAARLDWHNHGPRGSTCRDRPWSLAVSVEFPSEQEAVRFEKYLKSGSGRAFVMRHFAGLESARR
jgi:predicted GIY-YIG superfamily endonuclease